MTETFEAEHVALALASHSLGTDLGIDKQLTEAYRKRVQEVARVADGRELIQNRTPYHASVIISELFKKAQHDVKIICNNLADVAYGQPEVIKQASGFIQRGKIEILVEDEVSFGKSRFLNAFRDLVMSRAIDVRIVPDSVKAKYPYHFMVADALHYRLQPNRDVFDAFARFGDNRRNKWKIDAFQTIQKQSKPFGTNAVLERQGAVEI